MKLEEEPVAPQTPSSQTPLNVITQERIRTIVSDVEGLLAVTYDKNDKMVMDQSENPPYAITINTSASETKDCFDAKDRLFKLSKLKRVRFGRIQSRVQRLSRQLPPVFCVCSGEHSVSKASAM